MLTSCKKSIEPVNKSENLQEEILTEVSGRGENPNSFEQIGLLDIGNTGAAEISTYCKKN